MSDDDDFDDESYYSVTRRPATLGSLRRVHCDCVIELRPSGSASGAITRIEAHRAVLAGTAYFAALFERADPDRVEQKDGDGKRVFRAVYAVEAPFSADSLAFLVDCLYAPRRLDRIGACEDPVDVVQASLFVGMPADYATGLVEAALAGLFSDLSKSHGNGNRNDAEAVAQLGAFVRHILDSDIDCRDKTFMLERALGMLSDADRNAIAADHADLVPSAHYRPEAAVGDLVTDDDGRRWRALRIAVDSFGGADEASTIAWQGLVFGVRLRFTNYDNDPMLMADVSCAPEDETLGVWPWEQAAPDGAVDAEPRAVKFEVRAYHPTRGSSTEKMWAGLHGADKRTAEKQKERYCTAHGRTLPKGATLAPHAFGGMAQGTQRRADRSTQTAFLTKYQYGAGTMRSLVACEVEIRVEEICP
nr:BTB/POZ domain motif-containing protein [Pandoravirus belohorizontensis]